MSPRFFAEGVFFSAPVLPSLSIHPHRREIFRRLTLLAVRQRGLAAARRWLKVGTLNFHRQGRSEQGSEDNRSDSIVTSFMHDNQIKFSAKVGFAIVSLCPLVRRYRLLKGDG